MQAVEPEVEAILNQIVFQFVEDTTASRFNRKTTSGVIVVEKQEKQLEESRWAKVLSTGPEVDPAIQEGDFVLIQNLRWTNMFQLEKGIPYWITTDDEIIAIADKNDPPQEIMSALK